MAARESEPTLLVRMLGNSPKLRILDFFLDNPALDFSKSEVIKELGMSKQTFYKYFGDLEELEAVRVNRRFGKAKLYCINLDNPFVRALAEKELELSAEIAERQVEVLTSPPNKRQRVFEIIKELESRYGAASINKIKDMAAAKGISENFVNRIIDEEMKIGHIYRPVPKKIRLAVRYHTKTHAP